MTGSERRSYDVEIAELRNEVAELKSSISEMKTDIKDLVDAWKTARGITAFVRWLAGLIIAGGVIVAVLKGVSR